MAPWKRRRSLILPIARSREENEERSSLFIQNGSELLKGLIASCDGKCNPFRNFTAKEIISATNNFRNPQIYSRTDEFYKCCFENRDVLLRSFAKHRYDFCAGKEIINDIVITSRVSHHKNILKLLGCCLEFNIPSLVYEYSGHEQLSHLIDYDVRSKLSSWKSRIRIARDVANILVYLHTAFPTPIIYRDLKPENIVIDQFGLAKLFDFSLSISLPPGKLQVEDAIFGTYGYADPNYTTTGIITTKADVYSFGVLLLVLLTGREAFSPNRDGSNRTSLPTFVNECVGKNQLKKIVDQRLLSEGGEVKHEAQLQDFLELAIRCIQESRENRPEMIDIAIELKRIERSGLYCTGDPEIHSENAIETR